MSAMSYTPIPLSADFDEALLRHARYRAGACLGFDVHLPALLVANVGLAVIVPPYGQFWFVWPLLDWGLSLAAHGLGLAWNQGSGYQRMVNQEFACLREQAGRR